VPGPGRRLNRWLDRLAGAAAALAGASALAIVGFILASAWPLLTSGALGSILTGTWRPYAASPSYGIGAMIAASALLSALAVALAFPAALGLVGCIHAVGPRRLGRGVLGVVQFMTSIPTVVYGFVAVMLLVPRIRQLGAVGSGYCLLAAILTLALLILPTIVLVIHARLGQLAPPLLRTGQALGMTPVQALLGVVFPAARRSLTTALVLGFCRAIGDTLVALMVAGNAPQLPDSLLDSVRTLTAHIALVLATDSFSPEYRSISAAALLLFLLTALLSVVVRRLESRTPS
jgi:phosphate transport system permease protein